IKLLGQISTGVIQLTHHGIQLGKLGLVTGNGFIDAIANGQVLTKVVDTPQGAMVVNLYPVFAARQLSRVVLTMQTVSSLQGAEH
ncbi:hypothetical protein MJN54_30560, partial [Salmonella enterica subsp. enterica serovar Kentucky]|nr:hypothetical protein [Salmonella enterica subsp. enterica serovar Kentucky]